jgi:(R,R)-butanediol dehydrogenase/meso-butanediol dehydrogenase/diacetyl reductase
MRVVAFEHLGAPLVLAERPDPTPADDEVIVSVSRCGICGSDLHMSKEASFGARPGDIFGHEFAGIVLATGKEVERLRIGDPVSVVPLRSCGRCATCLAGEPAWCTEMALQGGGYAEYAAVRERQCCSLSRSFSLADGALAEPLAVALHGVQLSGLKAGAKALVIGAGPIGLSVAYWARRMGATSVVVQDIVRAQENRAMVLGATHFVCDPQDPVAATDTALGGKADIVFECVGAPGLIMQAAHQVRVKGNIVVLGLCSRVDGITPMALVSKEIRLTSSAFFTRQEYQASLDMLERDPSAPQALITSTIGLADVAATFEALKKQTNQCKVLINPAL